MVRHTARAIPDVKVNPTFILYFPRSFPVYLVIAISLRRTQNRTFSVKELSELASRGFQRVCPLL